jgi:Lecithin retinol acyltransferase
MNINYFIQRHGLKPADAIVAQKLQFGLLKHYIIYLGYIEGEHRFMANYTRGIELISHFELSRLLGIYGPTGINRFRGNEFQREQALYRAWSRRGEQEYNLIINNCEHYMNFVHHGKAKSEQVNDFGTGLALTGAAIAAGAAINKNENAAIGGLVLAGLGLLTLFMENDD